MRMFYAAGVFTLVRTFAKWSMPGSEEEILEEDIKKAEITAYESYYQTMNNLGLAASKASLEKIVTELKKENCTFGSLIDPSDEFIGRLVDETKSRAFFALNPREVELHNSPRKGWEKIIGRFPSTLDDVEEASKCYALSRYPASIFHSLQIVEAALIEFGKFIKVKDPKSGWTAVSGALSKIMKKEWKEKSQFEKKNHAFLEQVHGTVEGLKNAWRNKISHADGKLILVTKEYSPEVAEEIIFATRAFARRIAEGIPPMKKPKGAI